MQRLWLPAAIRQSLGCLVLFGPLSYKMEALLLALQGEQVS